MVRIDARTRNNEAHKDNFFSEWVSFNYVNNICKKIYDKPVTAMKSFEY
jgi:hypothetical protein